MGPCVRSNSCGALGKVKPLWGPGEVNLWGPGEVNLWGPG